jgi:ABC-type branched-subunit amino acid transport system substrate-binding protein
VPVVLAASLLVFGASCGSRLPGSLLRTAKDAALNSGGQSASAGPGSGVQAGGPSGLAVGTSSGSSPALATNTAAGQGTSGGANASVSPGAFVSAGGSPHSAVGSTPGISGPTGTVPAGGNGGATDVGVTATSITVGAATDLSGPVPGLFEGAVVGEKAYFNYINSTGGVFGRQLQLDVADSLTSCSGDEDATQQLVGKVFAFVGSIAVYDNCGAQILAQHPGIPDVSSAVSKEAAQLPNQFSAEPGGMGYQTGAYAYYAQTYGSAVQHAGDIYPDIPDTVTETGYEEAAAQSAGWKFLYKDAVEATDTNFTPDIVRMQAAGVQVVEMELTAQDCATLIQEEIQQNWHPTNILYFAYDRQFVQLAGGPSAANGVVGWTDSPLYFGSQDAAAIPSVGLFQTWMARTNPSQTLDTYAEAGWSHAALFVHALQAAGSRATRAAVLAALKGMTSYNGDGFVAPSNPAQKKSSDCFVLWKIENGNYVRVDTPATGYRCSGTSFYSYYLSGQTPP